MVERGKVNLKASGNSGRERETVPAFKLTFYLIV